MPEPDNTDPPAASGQDASSRRPLSGWSRLGRRQSLRVELVAVLAVVLMMAVVSLSLATELLGRRRHDAAQATQLDHIAERLAALITPQVASGRLHRSDTLDRALRPTLATQDIESILIYRVGSQQTTTLVEMGLPSGLDGPRRRLDGTIPDPPARLVGDRLVADEPVRSFGAEPSHVLRVVARPVPWTRAGDWRQITVLALGVGAIMLVLGVALLELQVLQPLGQIRQAVDRVAQGDLDARAPEDGPNELRGLAGALNQMAASLRDRIREVEAQRQQLVRAEQLATVGRVAAGMAHEVGNPLAALLGYVELVLDPRTEPPLSAEQRELLERSREQIERIRTLIDQLLDYSRPSPSRVESVSIVEAARGQLAFLGHDPRCKDVAFSVEGDPDVRARADPNRLEQVLQNLVVNAARAAREAQQSGDDHPPTVCVRVAADGSHVHLEVQDSGAGVPSEVRPRLFEPFFTTAQAGEGTGLGLAICQGLVESMAGTLSCEPNESPPLPGHDRSGAVFRVTLPRETDADLA